MTSLQALAALPRRLRILRRPSEPIRPAQPRPVRRDCHGRLQYALETFAGSAAQVTALGLKPWCSATFIGAQHLFLLDLPGEADPEAWLARLNEHVFCIPGHIVADIGLDGSAQTGSGLQLSLCILTIEEW